MLDDDTTRQECIKSLSDKSIDLTKNDATSISENEIYSAIFCQTEVLNIDAQDKVQRSKFTSVDRCHDWFVD